MSYKSIDTSRFHWCWKEYGNGPILLLAFHGFNRGPEDFHSFEKALGSKYTILSFDLFFHGNSYVKGNGDDAFYNRNELRDAVEQILSIYNKQSFEIMAYSFGGRLAFNIVEIMSARVNGLYLMAPDALRFNPGFSFTTQTLLGRWLITRFESNPGPALAVMKFMLYTRMYNKKAMSFFISQISYAPNRQKVFSLWMAHRKTVPQLRDVACEIERNNIKVDLFFGKYDMVIKPSQAKNLVKLLKGRAGLHLLECGHRLPEKHAEISEVILKRQ